MSCMTEEWRQNYVIGLLFHQLNLIYNGQWL